MRTCGPSVSVNIKGYQTEVLTVFLARGTRLRFYGVSALYTSPTQPVQLTFGTVGEIVSISSSFVVRFHADGLYPGSQHERAVGGGPATDVHVQAQGTAMSRNGLLCRRHWLRVSMVNMFALESDGEETRKMRCAPHLYRHPLADFVQLLRQL